MKMVGHWKTGMVLVTLISTVLSLSFTRLTNTEKARAAVDNNNLISDSAFVNIDSMSTADIQTFLTLRGGFLQSFSEGGRSAAQIIYDAAHGYGQASGTSSGITIDTGTGTVSPRVLLVTLQKEQGLLTMVNRNDDSLRKSMGYGCPDGEGCNAKYAGFTNQVEWAAWQLRFNYEAGFKNDSWRTQYYGSSGFTAKPGYPGQTVTIDSTSVTFANAASASLYRYTPHIQSFSRLYLLYFPSYSHQFISQNAYPNLGPGDAYNFIVTVKNTGTATWTKGVVNLATNRSRDRVPRFVREGTAGESVISGWLSANRIQFSESSVAPGQVATYSFWMRNDGVAPGIYREYFQLVADGGEWMEDYGIYWDVHVISLIDALSLRYNYEFVSQNAYPTLSRGQAYNFVVTVKNTGTKTWIKGTTNLATDRLPDRITSFLRESGDGSPVASGWTSPNRITMSESSVAPGQVATFSFWMQAQRNMTPGQYKEYFRPVVDGITWMRDLGIYWEVNVR